MMEIKELEANYKYNSRLDVIDIEITHEYKYEVSIDLEAGVYLHFDENYFPVGLEIIDASKKIGVDESFLINPSGNVEIVISKDLIKVEVIFENNDENGSLHLNAIGESYMPNIETCFALI